MSLPPYTEQLAVVTNSFELKIPLTFRYHQYDGEYLNSLVCAMLISM